MCEHDFCIDCLSRCYLMGCLTIFTDLLLCIYWLLFPSCVGYGDLERMTRERANPMLSPRTKREDRYMFECWSGYGGVDEVGTWTR